MCSINLRLTAILEIKAKYVSVYNFIDNKVKINGGTKMEGWLIMLSCIVLCIGESNVNK